MRRSRTESSRYAGSKRRRLAASALTGVAVNLALAVAALGQTAIDGDSLQVGGKAYSLHGLDAAEIGQVCADGWPAGDMARRYLQELIEGKGVVCVRIAGARGKETDAVCRADGVDVGGAMVTAGQAFAFVPHSARYIAQEEAAAQSRRGVHGHQCLPPWEWRSTRQEN